MLVAVVLLVDDAVAAELEEIVGLVDVVETICNSVVFLPCVGGNVVCASEAVSDFIDTGVV